MDLQQNIWVGQRLVQKLFGQMNWAKIGFKWVGPCFS